jgi:hypothetical protein
MRYRTAAILSVVLIGGMFALPAAVMAAFLPSSEQGPPTPILGYERILLEAAAFCFAWRVILALPIVVVLFAVALFTNERVPKNHPAATSLKRPTGVTVIAVVNILAGLAVATLLLVSSQPLEGALLWILFTAVLLGVGLGAALLMLQNWARVLTIVGCVLSLIAIPARVVMAHSPVNAMAALARGFYFLWIVWYLLRPHIKVAFARA